MACSVVGSILKLSREVHSGFLLLLDVRSCTARSSPSKKVMPDHVHLEAYTCSRIPFFGGDSWRFGLRGSFPAVHQAGKESEALLAGGIVFQGNSDLGMSIVSSTDLRYRCQPRWRGNFCPGGHCGNTVHRNRLRGRPEQLQVPRSLFDNGSRNIP